MNQIVELQGALDAHGERVEARQTIYVYEALVRLWHWVNAFCIVALCLSGYFIGSPLPSVPGEASQNFQIGRASCRERVS
jgi:Ni/Fe-hydrogenase 1 B-type cytochrome subunit